jgi:hypothetical protein
MRAVTWTQVAQYIILIIAYMIPVVWLSVKQTSVPVPQAVYGYQLQKVTAKEADLIKDPRNSKCARSMPTVLRRWAKSSRTQGGPGRRQGSRNQKSGRPEGIQRIGVAISPLPRKRLRACPRMKLRPRRRGHVPRRPLRRRTSRLEACHATPRSLPETPTGMPRRNKP